MPTDVAAKLPEIEHIKARKDGLDVLADIYRYAELGFDAIDAGRPGPVPVVRRLHPARRGVGRIGRAGPIRGDRRPLHAADQVPERDRDRGAAAQIGRLSVRYGRRIGDIATRRNIQLHLAADEGHPGRPLRAERRRALVHARPADDVYRRNIVGYRLADVRRARAAQELAPPDRQARSARSSATSASRTCRASFKVSVSGSLHRCASARSRHRPTGRGRA